jgi:hypothetical protein
MLMRTFIAAMVLLALSGCGQRVGAPSDSPSPTHPQASASSGVEGTTTVDNGYPVSVGSAGSQSPRRPIRARLIISLTGSASPAAQAESGTDGHFRIPLAPGRYTIQPQNLSGAPVPIAYSVTVTVRPGTWTTVPVSFDSGVR